MNIQINNKLSIFASKIAKNKENIILTCLSVLAITALVTAIILAITSSLSFYNKSYIGCLILAVDLALLFFIISSIFIAKQIHTIKKTLLQSFPLKRAPSIDRISVTSQTTPTIIEERFTDFENIIYGDVESCTPDLIIQSTKQINESLEACGLCKTLPNNDPDPQYPYFNLMFMKNFTYKGFSKLQIQNTLNPLIPRLQRKLTNNHYLDTELFSMLFPSVDILNQKDLPSLSPQEVDAFIKNSSCSQTAIKTNLKMFLMYYGIYIIEDETDDAQRIIVTPSCFKLINSKFNSNMNTVMLSLYTFGLQEEALLLLETQEFIRSESLKSPILFSKSYLKSIDSFMKKASLIKKNSHKLINKFYADIVF